MRFAKFIALLFLLLSGYFLPARQPAYFIFGENQFKGVQIYDIIQDKDLNYWIATNEGLFYFNHYTFEKIECSPAKSNSVFNFVVNHNGVIYCHNLNNQVFEIQNKTCHLFYELNPEEANSDISLAVTSKNHLVIGAKKIIILSEDGKVRKRISVDRHYLGPPFTDEKGNLFYHLSSSDSLLKISGELHSEVPLKLHNYKVEKKDVLKFFSVHNENYAINLTTKALFTFDTENFNLHPLVSNSAFERSQSIRFYNTKNHLWIAGTLPGVVMLNKKVETGEFDLFYEDYFISHVYEDKEGNILLATFDKGILVIPDMQIPDVIHSFKEDPISSLIYLEGNGLFLGSSRGLLLEYDGAIIRTLNNAGKRPIEHLYSGTNFPYVVFDDGYIRAYDIRKKTISNICEASLKDAVIVSESVFYLGTNRGIIKCSVDAKSNFKCENIKEFSYRIYSLCLNSINKNIYAATSNGLFIIKPDGSFEKITYKGEDLFPNTLKYYDGIIYAADKKGGLLMIENNQVKSTLAMLINGQTEVISKFIIHNHQIIAKCNKGLFQFDLKGKLLNALSTSQGFSSNRVIDFTGNKNLLYVSHTNGVQQIDLNGLQAKSTSPNIQLSDVLVNDVSIDFKIVSDLKSTQRKIHFILRSPTLRNRENIFYHYKLEGNDAQWSVNDYNGNQITYNALAPGHYTFLVKAEKQGVFSETISYTFTIAAPFYTAWWFITLSIAVFLIFVYGMYRWQLNIQNKKAQRINELNASKLTAIQSQMNPHFIFNSLNSIQDLILKGDVENSYSYISTFSDLVRRTLNYSEKDFIDFEQEIKLLELYLSLEKLRFKKDFNYSIEINDISDVQIPPMLIQPFIENALVHGLLHKEGIKNLNIRFELNENLHCVIEDNGIGREKSKQIKLRQRQGHESFSGKAIKKRFEILSHALNGEFGYRYEDIPNEGGTRVIITMPFKHKF